MTEEQETKTYQVRLAVTARVFAEETFEAVDDDAALKYVEALDPDDFIYTYTSDDGREGDEIAFWGLDSDDTPEAEVVLMKVGEPFSWTAVEIVKDLAKQGGKVNFDELAKLVRRAIAACSR